MGNFNQPNKGGMDKILLFRKINFLLGIRKYNIFNHKILKKMNSFSYHRNYNKYLKNIVLNKINFSKTEAIISNWKSK